MKSYPLGMRSQCHFNIYLQLDSDQATLEYCIKHKQLEQHYHFMKDETKKRTIEMLIKLGM